MKYADAQRAKDANRPLAVEEVPPSVWAQTWTERPREPVMIGLRSLAEVVLSEITGAAQTEANRIAPGGDDRSAIWAAEYSAAVRRISLGRAMCQPDHADVGWFNYPDLESAQAFSPEGAAWLFARLDAAIVGCSVLASEEDPAGPLEAGAVDDETGDPGLPIPLDAIEDDLVRLPKVSLHRGAVPAHAGPGDRRRCLRRHGRRVRRRPSRRCSSSMGTLTPGSSRAGLRPRSCRGCPAELRCPPPAWHRRWPRHRRRGSMPPFPRRVCRAGPWRLPWRLPLQTSAHGTRPCRAPRRRARR